LDHHCFAGAAFGFYEAGLPGAVLGGFIAYALAFVLRLIILVIYLVAALAYAGLLTLVVLSRGSRIRTAIILTVGGNDGRSPHNCSAIPPCAQILMRRISP
jgi:hypothetical protein